MELGITIPLQKFLKLKQPPYGTCPDPLFCWDVHRVKIANGKVLMIVSNASSYFAAVTRMTAATWKRWEGEAVGAIADSMAVSGLMSHNQGVPRCRGSECRREFLSPHGWRGGYQNAWPHLRWAHESVGRL